MEPLSLSAYSEEHATVPAHFSTSHLISLRSILVLSSHMYSRHSTVCVFTGRRAGLLGMRFRFPSGSRGHLSYQSFRNDSEPITQIVDRQHLGRNADNPPASSATLRMRGNIPPQSVRPTSSLRWS